MFVHATGGGRCDLVLSRYQTGRLMLGLMTLDTKLKKSWGWWDKPEDSL